MESLFPTSPWVQVQVNAVFTKPSCDVIKVAKSKTRVDEIFAIWGTFTELYRFAVPFKDSIGTRSIITKDWNLKTYYRIEKFFIVNTIYIHIHYLITSLISDLSASSRDIHSSKGFNGAAILFSCFKFVTRDTYVSVLFNWMT